MQIPSSHLVLVDFAEPLFPWNLDVLTKGASVPTSPYHNRVLDICAESMLYERSHKITGS